MDGNGSSPVALSGVSSTYSICGALQSRTAAGVARHRISSYLKHSAVERPRQASRYQPKWPQHLIMPGVTPPPREVSPLDGG